MTVTQTSGSVIAQPGQQFALSSLLTFGSGLPATIGIAILDDNNYTNSNLGALGHFSGNGTVSQVYTGGAQQKDYTYEVFQYDAGKGDYYNSTLGYLNNLTYVAPTGNDHAELLTVFSFKNGVSLDYGNLTDLGDLSVVTTTSFVNPFAGAAAGQATPNEIVAIAQSFVGQVWNSNGCQLLGNVIAGLAGSSLPFTAVATISAPSSPVLALPNGEWIVAYDGRAQANPSYAAVEAMIRPGDVINVAWENTSDSNGHFFTVVSGSGINALVIDNEDSGTNSAKDGSANDILILQPHSLDDTLNEYFVHGGGAVPASIEVYRLDTPVVAAQAAPASLPAESHLALAGLFTASDPAGKAIVSYQVYNSATGNEFIVGGTEQTAHSAATAVTVDSLGLIALSVGTSGGSDTLEVRGYNGTYWGDWQALTVTSAPAPTAAQAISNAAAGQVVLDSAANVVVSLDGLAGLAAKGDLASITLTDSGTPNLAVTAAQWAADSVALEDISSSHTVTVQFADQTAIVAATPGSANAVTTGNITELYSAVLAREPDISGLGFYQTYLKVNPSTPLLQFADWFLSSTEYTAKHNYTQGTAGDTQFIEDSYQNLLNRAPSADEVSFYLTHVMSQPNAHALMLVYFSASPEFLADVQITAQNPASAQHWLILT